jgi:4-amino-4-deoxy-L-arabinose transferase-like glycosyltransferase
MAEPIPPHSVAAPARAGIWHRAPAGLITLALVLQVALGLRIVAADAIDLYVHRGGSTQLCLFDDTKIYWGLARAIREGAPYEYVEWSDIPHFALRTPGYPLFLAICQALFGRRTLAVRIVQAGLGSLSVYLIYWLTRQLAPADEAGRSGENARSRRTAPVVAAALAAINPNYIIMSTILLSEAVFVPLMLAALWGLAVLWAEPGRTVEVKNTRAVPIAVGSGCAAGLAILVRPSWALFVPVILLLWVIASLRNRRALAGAVRGAMFFALGLAVMMSPWWIRNARIYGRFVPTALWMGASLYDGLNPRATGASDMLPFLRDHEIWPLDEQDQDAELTRRAVAFAREQPARVLSLALVKLGRYWSPWPNAVGIRSPVLVLAGAVVELPLFGLMVLGAWDRRHDPRARALLAGPLLYFCLLHMVFASSMRYRIPGEMPALGLAAIGWTRVRERLAADR